MMCVAVAVVLSLAGFAAPQDPPPQEDLAKKVEELAKRVAALEKEKSDLKKQLDDLERFSLDAAETISRLKQMIKNGGGNVPTGDAPVGGPKPAGGPDRTQGPSAPVTGKIFSVAPEHGFIIVNLGEDDGVKEGWMFEVVRTHKDEKGNFTNELLGKAVFEKYVETRRATQSKLKIVEGDAEKMKYGDSVVANRRLDPVAPPKEPGDKPVAKPADGKYKIVGITGDTYFLNAGTKNNVKQSDKVYIYRDKRAIAQLRLDQVGPDFAAAKIIDGTKTAEPAIDDEVLLKDPKTSLVAKVKRIDDKSGIYIEIGQTQGVKAGMQFEVRRQGRVVGKIVVKQLGPHHSVCDPVGTLTAEEVHLDDFVESVEQ
jgi:hypothetical protein